MSRAIVVSPVKLAESVARDVSARITGTCAGGSDRFSAEQATSTARLATSQSFRVEITSPMYSAANWLPRDTACLTI